MASYINPKCAMPLFMMDNHEDACNCGYLQGAVTSVICGVVSLSAVAVLCAYIQRMPEQGSGVSVKHVVGGCVILLLLLWLYPHLSSWLSGVQYKGYHEQINSLMNKGFTRDQAVSKTQDLYQAQLQASAINNIGSNISGYRNSSSSGANGFVEAVRFYNDYNSKTK